MSTAAKPPLDELNPGPGRAESAAFSPVPTVSAHQRARLFALFCACCALTTGAIGLVDACTGQRLFGGTLLHQYIPMAVSTALLTMVLSAALAATSQGRTRQPLLLAAMAMATLLAAKVFAEFVFKLPGSGLEQHYDSLLVLLQTSTTPMSPVTGALLFLTGCAAMVLYFRSGRVSVSWLDDVAGYLGVAVCFVSLTLIGGYVHGEPYFYGTEVVPVALTTSLTSLLMGVSIICAAGPGSHFLRAFFGDSAKARLMRIFPPFVALMFLLHPLVEDFVSKIFNIDPDLLFSLQVMVLVTLTTTITAIAARIIGLSMDRETARRKQAEDSSFRESRINKAQAEIAEALIRPGMTLQILSSIVHNAATRLTGSAFAFVSTIDPATGDSIGHTLATMLDTGQCGLGQDAMFKRAPDGSYPGLWGHALNTLKAFYDNAPAHHPSSRGLPAGHVPLEQFLSAPVRYEQLLVGQISLANPGRNYTQGDLGLVQSLADLFALGVSRIRSEQEILAAKAELEQTVLQRTRALEEANAHLQREMAEREMFQEALKGSAVLFRAVVEDQTEFICRFKPDGTILFANNAYARFFETTTEELIGQTHFSFLPEQVQEQVKHLLADISVENPVATIEHVVLSPSGKESWQAWTNRGIFDEQGRLLAYQAVGHDISQAKEAEKVLRELNEKLEEKVHERTKSIELINTDLQMQIETRRLTEEALADSSKALQAKVRQITCLYELSDILGSADLGPEEMLKKAVAKVPTGWQTPETVAVRLVFDGEERCSSNYSENGLCLRRAVQVFGVERGQLTVCDFGLPEADASFSTDELALFSSVVHQIEHALESRLSKDVLTRSEQKFREFFDNAADAIFVHDVNGNILDANRNAGSWLNATTETLRAENLLHLAHEADREKMAADFKGAAQGQSVLIQATLVRADGFPIPMEFNCLALDYQGSQALFSSGRNIANRLKNENEILRRMEMEVLMADISEHLVNTSTERFVDAFELSLGELGRFLDFEHVAVFTYAEESRRFHLAHQWRDKGQKPLGGAINGFDRRLTPVLLERLPAQEKLIVRNVDQMPPAAKGKALLREAGIRNFVAVPMTLRGSLRGALLLAGTRETMSSGFSELGLLDNAALLLTNAQEKHSVDRSLRQSERLAKSIIESLSANICVVNRSGVLTMVNKAWERFAQNNGPTRAANLGVGANYVEVCRRAAAAGEPLGAEAADGLAAVLAGKRASFNLEYACHSGTEQRWFIMQAVPFTSGGRGAVIAHRDITMRVLAAENMRKSEERYRIIVETAQEGVLGVDAEARIIYINPRMLSMLGYEPDELIGRLVPEIIAPEDQELLRKKQQERRQGIVDHYELRYLSKSGARIWTVTSVAPVKGPDGSYMGTIGMALDISDRVRAEQQIRKSEARYRSLVEAIHEGLLMIKANGTISYLNAPFERMLGRPRAEILGRSVESFVSTKYKAAMATLLSGDSKDAGTMEIVWKHSSGRHTYSLFSLSKSQDGEGGIMGYFAIVTDTTERKTLESQLLQSQKLEAIGQLAAGIAHEINTPAQYVGNNVQFLKTAFADILSVCSRVRELMQTEGHALPTQADMGALATLMAERDIGFLETEVPSAINQTLEGVERISSIVRSVKQFAHPGAAVMSSADLNEAMLSTVTVSRNEWKYVAELTTDLDKDMPLVICMIGEINQVVLNLIINASHAIADATKADPERKGLITITTKHAPPWAEIRVSDTGLGIPPSVQGKIFDPFFTTKEVGRGTGQGLTIARSIVVDKHKGQLYFETEVGVGTTFVVRLPLEHAEELEQ